MAACLFPVSQALRGHYGEEASTKLVDYAQLDAFTAEAFKGNPAVVCLLPIARSTEWMQNIAAEFSAPMAAFLVHRSSLGIVTSNTQECNNQDTMNGDSSVGALSNSHTISGKKASEYDVRFFTPTAEVDLCGHAMLASAYLTFKSNLARGSDVVFHTDTATFKVSKIMGGESGEDWQGQVELKFPILDTSPVATNMEAILPRTLQGCKVISTRTDSSDRVILELPSAREVETLEPSFEEILAGPGAVIVTGKGTAGSPYDFVSRFFAPKYGVPEDPVCGTAHCALAPLWAAKLGKENLVAYQASKRGGVLELVVDNASKCVLLRGTAVVVATGVLPS